MKTLRIQKQVKSPAKIFDGDVPQCAIGVQSHVFRICSIKVICGEVKGRGSSAMVEWNVVPLL